MRRLFLFLSIGIILIVIKWLNPTYMSSFNYETAQHYLEMIRFNDGLTLLDGPLTSHPWLRLSSAPYYLFYPILTLFNFHPLTLPWVWTMTSGLIIVLHFVVVRRWFNRTVAGISSGLMLFSPLFLYFDNHIGFYSFVIPLMYGLWWEIEAVARRRASGWRAALYVSLMLCLHASALMLVPVLLLLLWRYRQFNRKTVAAFIFPQLPLLLKALFNHDFSFVYVVGWIPYRIWQFLSGKTLGLNRAIVADTTGLDVMNFFKLSLFPDGWSWWWGMVIATVLIIFGWRYRHEMVKKQYWWWELLLVAGLLSLIVHKNPPFHYFVPLVSIPVILLAQGIAHLPRWILAIGVVGLMSVQLPVWWRQTRFQTHVAPNQYTNLVAMAKEVIQVADNQPYRLVRVGQFDYYPGQAKEQFEYLVWYLGKPTTPMARRVITIDESTSIPQITIAD